MKMVNRIILILSLVIMTACAKIGPDIIQASGNDYNIAIQRTIDEQLLLQRGLEIDLPQTEGMVRKAIVNAMIDKVVVEGQVPFWPCAANRNWYLV